MTAPRPNPRRSADPLPPAAENTRQSTRPLARQARAPRLDRALPAPRDNPDAQASASRVARPRQPRTSTAPKFAARRLRSRANEQATSSEPTMQERDRWDEEWRDEWERGDVDDSAAYDELLDVAEQSRDIEWLLDALDALEDTGDDDAAFEWDS